MMSATENNKNQQMTVLEKIKMVNNIKKMLNHFYGKNAAKEFNSFRKDGYSCKQIEEMLSRQMIIDNQ